MEILHQHIARELSGADWPKSDKLDTSLQRKPTPLAPVPYVQRKHRRSCHGSATEQQEASKNDLHPWAAAQPYLDSLKSSDTCDSIAYVSFSSKPGRMAAAAAAEDDGGSHQQDQQVVPEQQLRNQEISNPELSSATQSMQAASRFSSPFAAPEVQSCTCHKRSSRCKLHPHKSSTTGSTTGKQDRRSGPRLGKWIKATCGHMWQGLTFASWPATTVPGAGGVCVGANRPY